MDEETKKLLKGIQAEQERMKKYVFGQIMAQGCQIDRAQILSNLALAIGASNFVLLWII